MDDKALSMRSLILESERKKREKKRLFYSVCFLRLVGDVVEFSGFWSLRNSKLSCDCCQIVLSRTTNEMKVIEVNLKDGTQSISGSYGIDTT